MMTNSMSYSKCVELIQKAEGMVLRGNNKVSATYLGLAVKRVMSQGYRLGEVREMFKTYQAGAFLISGKPKKGAIVSFDPADVMHVKLI